MPDQTPEPLTDDKLREIARCGRFSHDPDIEPPNWWGQKAADAATELLAARTRITNLESGRDTQQTMLRGAVARIAELEAVQGDLVGYVVAARRHDGEFCGATIWTDPDRAKVAEGTANGYETGDPFRVFELREVRDDA